MASPPSTSGLLLFSLLLAISALSAASRPCKTIFFINYPLPKPNPPNSPRLTFFVTEIREFRRTRSFPRPMLFDRSIISASSDVVSSQPYYSASSSIKTSIRERTMDVMSVVGAVLFGVGCGALTAATMYLFWSLFAPRRFDFESDSEESGDEENDVSPNNSVGNKTVPPSADEVDAMKSVK
ncbi:hypothetical protein SSX86_010579 [Deinandra increscens subsp. villosa]|uniref:Transmembrane protein n=1 Tax=Deinandra increscens subsp. villosa TaxID=3103831 RepID=A0AAP0DFI9_9ASTR